MDDETRAEFKKLHDYLKIKFDKIDKRLGKLQGISANVELLEEDRN